MTDLTFVDSDGHILEHPTGMLDFTPKEYADRVWHIETRTDGTEWCIYGDQRMPANVLALAGTAGMSLEDRERAQKGQMRYTEIAPAAYDPKARLEVLDQDGIDISVLYPTMLLGIAGLADHDFAAVQCRAYNDWLSEHVSAGEGRLFGVAIVPQQNLELAAAEIRRVAGKPGIVGVMLRPNPTEDWKPFHHEVYDPLWRALSDTGLPAGFHPFLVADLPGACRGLRINRLGIGSVQDGGGQRGGGPDFDNVYFTQAISNPFDMMNTMAFVLAGGLCERYPELRFVFLESNGGWIVPWLERLDHHREIFTWDVPWLRHDPSEYFRRQCWISFDPDESTLAFSANSPLVGADRIVWASDYPHPDAKFPGQTAELRAGMTGLTPDQQVEVAGASCRALYGI
jgi:predicted TIM-barrel fold metal-dependent hydrolase